MDLVSSMIMSIVIISLKKIVHTTEALFTIITLGQLPMLTDVQKHVIYFLNVNTGYTKWIIMTVPHVTPVIGHVPQLQVRNIHSLRNVQASEKSIIYGDS